MQICVLVSPNILPTTKNITHWGELNATTIFSKSDVVEEIPGSPSLFLNNLKGRGGIIWGIVGLQYRALLSLLLAACCCCPQSSICGAWHRIPPLFPELSPILGRLCQPLSPPLLPRHQLPALLHQLPCVASLLQELLEAKEGEETGSEGEISSKGEDEEQDGEVDVEGVGDYGDDVHMTHDSRVRRLFLPVLNHM